MLKGGGGGILKVLLAAKLLFCNWSNYIVYFVYLWQAIQQELAARANNMSFADNRAPELYSSDFSKPTIW